MNTLESLFKPFSISIYTKASYLKNYEMSEFEKARYLESISDDIKKCTNFLKPKASKKAIEKAIEIGINIKEMNWHNQNKYDKGRQIFHFEHLIPVSSIRNMCLSSNSEYEVLKILLEKTEVVWILKEEDRRLTKLGYRSKRDNPKKAYENAKIELID